MHLCGALKAALTSHASPAPPHHRRCRSTPPGTVRVLDQLPSRVRLEQPIKAAAAAVGVAQSPSARVIRLLAAESSVEEVLDGVGAPPLSRYIHPQLDAWFRSLRVR